VEPKQIEWLWENRLARGKLTLLAGEPGIGKSQISLDIAARISKGDLWPDGGHAPLGSVVILSAEDSSTTRYVRVSKQPGPTLRAYTPFKAQRSRAGR